jgi:hypothetical protein
MSLLPPALRAGNNYLLIVPGFRSAPPVATRYRPLCRLVTFFPLDVALDL